MYALIEYKGKQYKVERGSSIVVHNISEVAPGGCIDVREVLMIGGEGLTRIGSPYLEGVGVRAVVGECFRSRKITVYKYKSKKDYHRTIGHRQWYTRLTVSDILGV